MSFLNRIVSAVASLFGGAKGPRGPGSFEFTDGSRLVSEPAHISFTPERGWGIIRTPGEQKDSDPQICNPTLMCRESMITSIYLPFSDQPLAAQASQFLGKQTLHDLQVEEVSAASGVPLVRARATTKVGKDGGRAKMVFHLLLNGKGRMTAVYCIGSPDLTESFAKWFPASVRLEA